MWWLTIFGNNWSRSRRMRTTVRVGVVQFGICLCFLLLTLTHECDSAAKAKKGKGKSKSRSRNPAAATNQNCGLGQAFHNDTENCYEVGSKGPCREQMKFYVDADAEIEGFGDCDCERTAAECPDQAPNIYWSAEDRCYPAFEIGPCLKTEWLVVNSNTGDSECRKNPCLAKKIGDTTTADADADADGEMNETSTITSFMQIFENVTSYLATTATEEPEAAETTEDAAEIGDGADDEDDGATCQCSALKNVKDDNSTAEDCRCTQFVALKMSHDNQSGSASERFSSRIRKILLIFSVLAAAVAFGIVGLQSWDLGLG